MANHRSPSRAGEAIKARVKNSSSPWHSTTCRVEQRVMESSPPKVSIRFKNDVTIELRRSQAIELINHIADTLEGSHHV